MSTKERSVLKKETLALVQELIQLNLDSYQGCQDVADSVVNLTVAGAFREIAGERKHQAEELKKFILQAGEEPHDSGSLAGAAHRVLMDLRQALGGGISAVLAEAERGEDHIKEKYEEAMRKAKGSPVSDTLDRQYNAVKHDHDRVRELRNAHQH